MWLARRRYLAIMAAIVKLQGWTRMVLQRIWFQKQVAAATKLQAFARMIKPRKAFLKIHEENRRLRLIERERLKGLGAREVGDVTTVPMPNDLIDLLNRAKNDEWRLGFDGIKSLIRVDEAIWDTGTVLLPQIQNHIAGHEFSKFQRGFFRQGSQWAFSKGPINQTFLKIKAGIDEDDVLLLFNVILRFMGDPSVDPFQVRSLP
jgi:hypothetical protein